MPTRRSSKPAPDEALDQPNQPGAHRVRGINWREDEETQYTTSQPTPQTPENPPARQESRQFIAVEAEAVPDESVLEARLEEQILSRIIQNAPIAEVANTSAEPQQPEEDESEKKARQGQNERINKRKWVLFGAIVILVALGLGLGLGFGLSSEKEDPVDTQADDCFRDPQGAIVCVKEGFPAPFLLTMFLNCPSTTGEDVFACEQCEVYLEDTSVQEIDENTPVCDSCVICRDSVAYDCMRLSSPGDPCSFRDCDGNCGKGDLANPSDETRADECVTESDGTITCFKEGIPESFLLTKFEGCPSTMGNNVFECDRCSVILEDNLEELDENDPICNGCLVCGEAVSFDCSNLRPDGDRCARRTCDGTCAG